MRPHIALSLCRGDVLKAAKKRLLLMVHPDKNAQDALATEATTMVQHAFLFLMGGC